MEIGKFFTEEACCRSR